MQRWLDSDNFKSTVLLTFIGLALLSVSSVAFAQGASNDYQIGLPQHGEFSGSDFENVQVNNNNLHIDLWCPSSRPSVGRSPDAPVPRSWS